MAKASSGAPAAAKAVSPPAEAKGISQQAEAKAVSQQSEAKGISQQSEAKEITQTNETTAAKEANPPLPPITFTVERPKFHWLAPKGAAGGQHVPKMIDGLDTRPWSSVVGWRPGESQFPTAENFQGMPLFWINIEQTAVTP